MVNSKINGQIQMIKECFVVEFIVIKILWEINVYIVGQKMYMEDFKILVSILLSRFNVDYQIYKSCSVVVLRIRVLWNNKNIFYVKFFKIEYDFFIFFFFRRFRILLFIEKLFYMMFFYDDKILVDFYGCILRKIKGEFSI